MSTTRNNPFLLAADDSPQLLPLLRSDPTIASSQDEHGYSLVHAAASYNHLQLLRTLIHEFKVPVNIRDEDGETALFVAETVECARVLVEELHADIGIKGQEGKTALEKIEEEGEFPEVALYLRSLDSLEDGTNNNDMSPANGSSSSSHPPRLPNGVSISIGTVPAEEIEAEVVDMEFRRRIEELASRGDFEGEEGQRELRDLITQALRSHVEGEREVRQRTD